MEEERKISTEGLRRRHEINRELERKEKVKRDERGGRLDVEEEEEDMGMVVWEWLEEGRRRRERDRESKRKRREMKKWVRLDTRDGEGGRGRERSIYGVGR